MPVEKEYYWLGDGFLSIGGKDYGAGTPLPAGWIDSLSEAELNQLVAKGRLGRRIEFAKPAKDVQLQADLDAANEVIKNLEREVEDYNTELDAALAKIKQLDADIEEKAALIEKLSTKKEKTKK
jgi:chromosome segregation ATPase